MQAESLIQSDSAINGINTSRVEFLLIRRRDSLGFIDIMRGKYKINDIPYISTQIRGMTGYEQQKLLTEPFDQLWEQLWGTPTNGANPYRHEKEQSKQKLEALRTGSPNLEEIIKTVGNSWKEPEWGFPKGRRDTHESEYACALREMWEETGLTEKDVVPIKNLEPLREVFFGSNNIPYCHKYYILYVPDETKGVYDPTNEHMKREIGDLRWCSLEEGLALIRQENLEKRLMLQRVSRLLRDYCPFQIGSKIPAS